MNSEKDDASLSLRPFSHFVSVLQNKSCVVSSNKIKAEAVTYCYNSLRYPGPLNQLFRGVTHHSTSQYGDLIGSTLPSLSKWIRCKTKRQKAYQFRCVFVEPVKPTAICA